MDRKGLLEFLGKDWTEVQSLIYDSLRSEIPLLQTTNDSLIGHSGKQLRPILCLLMARACNGGVATPDSLHYAAASELLHNATLLHDDVTDESSTRRGEPTLWARFGASPAVLVGDFWLSKAVEMVIGAESRDRVLKFFSSTMSDLAEGEMLQLERSGDGSTTEEDYFRIIRCKTASLFRASIVSAAVSADASEEKTDAAGEYADALGVAFQIKDDILDYCGAPEMGKPSGVDIRERKVTLPLLGAFRNCPQREREIRKALIGAPGSPELCSVIHNFAVENGGLEYASSVLDSYIDRAVRALDIFENSREKDYLAEIARYNALRTV